MVRNILFSTIIISNPYGKYIEGAALIEEQNFIIKYYFIEFLIILY